MSASSSSGRESPTVVVVTQCEESLKWVMAHAFTGAPKSLARHLRKLREACKDNKRVLKNFLDTACFCEHTKSELPPLIATQAGKRFGMTYKRSTYDVGRFASEAREYDDCAEELLRFGASLDVVDDNGCSFWEMAMMNVAVLSNGGWHVTDKTWFECRAKRFLLMAPDGYTPPVVARCEAMLKFSGADRKLEEDVSYRELYEVVAGVSGVLAYELMRVMNEVRKERAVSDTESDRENIVHCPHCEHCRRHRRVCATSDSQESRKRARNQ